MRNADSGRDDSGSAEHNETASAQRQINRAMSPTNRSPMRPLRE